MKRFVLIFIMLPVLLFSQSWETKGIASGDTLTDAFTINHYERPVMLQSEGANASDTLHFATITEDGTYKNIYSGNEKYMVVGSNVDTCLIILDPDVFRGVSKLKVDLEDAAADSVNFKLYSVRDM